MLRKYRLQPDLRNDTKYSTVLTNFCDVNYQNGGLIANKNCITGLFRSQFSTRPQFELKLDDWNKFFLARWAGNGVGMKPQLVDI